MAKFKDKTGREWTFELTLQEVLDIKRAYDLNLAELYKPDCPAARLLTDEETLINVVWDLLKGKDDQQLAFVRSLDGDVVEAMFLAVLEAVADFFPSRKAALKEIVDKILKARDLARKRGQDRLATMTPEWILGTIDEARRTSSDSPSSSPVSAASMPVA
jgi:hypothetical protein